MSEKRLALRFLPTGGGHVRMVETKSTLPTQCLALDRQQNATLPPSCVHEQTVD